jgi:hypothetical protein
MMERLRGLKSLVVDAVEHGSRAVERIQKETVGKPLDLLEQIPPLAVPVKGIHEIHDTAVSGIHEVIRLVNRVTGDTLDVVIAAVEKRQAEAAAEAAEAPPPEPQPGGLGAEPPSGEPTEPQSPA